MDFDHEGASMKVILAGATGLVGGLALENLLARRDVSLVKTLTRSPIDARASNHRVAVAPKEAWPDLLARETADIGVCCLGTTIRSAGSKEEFAAVDQVAVCAFAQACHGAGARQFIMVSSVGADPESRNFYLRTKGKAESAVRDIGFDRLDILRPGLLVGRRTGPIRMGERLAIALSPITDALTPNVLSRYRSVPATIVADAVSQCAGSQGRGVFKHHNDDMLSIRSVLD